MPTGFGKRQIRSMQNWAAGKVPADTFAGIWWVSFQDGDPGDDGQSGAEASGGSYAPVATVAADWNVATDATPSVLNNANPVTFPQATADWTGAVAPGDTFDFFGLWGHATLRTETEYVGRGALLTPAPVLDGQTPNFPATTLRMRGTQTP